MMMLTRALKPVLLLLGALALNGCVWVEDPGDLRRFVQTVKQAKAPPIKPLPEFKPYHSFVYEGASLRNPFQLMVAFEPSSNASDTEAQGADNGIRPDQDRPKAYLEEFSVDALQMVGTIGVSSTGKLWALVKDDKGEVHRVKAGDYMGLDFGQVVAVNNGFIELKEIVSNGRGGWMIRQRSITMEEK